MDSGSLALNLCTVPTVKVRMTERQQPSMVWPLGSGSLGQSGQNCKRWHGRAGGLARSRPWDALMRLLPRIVPGSLGPGCGNGCVGRCFLQSLRRDDAIAFLL